MDIVWTVGQVVFFLLFPALAVIGARRNKVLGFLDPVVICYLTGILLANIPGLPLDGELAGTITGVTVLLAIPMLLFSSDVRSWIRVAPKALLSFALAIVSVVTVAAVAHYLFVNWVPDAHKIAGMTIGVYTGGTPNMSAIGIALKVPEETFILLNAADVVMALLYIPLLVTVLIRFLRRFYPRYVPTGAMGPAGGDDGQPFLRAANARRVVASSAIAVGLSAVAVGASIGLAMLFKSPEQTLDDVLPLIILGITTLGIAASFVRRIRTVPGTYDVGQYILLVFCLAIGTQADLGQLFSALGPLAAFLTFVFWGTVVLHFALNWVARIDADTAAITSIAALMGPPLVGPIAGALKNRELVLAGVTTGVIGYAVGNYIGLGLAWVLGP